MGEASACHLSQRATYGRHNPDLRKQVVRDYPKAFFKLVLTKMKADLAEFEAMLHSALKSSEVRSASTHAEESVLRARARGAQKGAKPLGYS
jgi:hypothetical protein